MAKQVFDIKAWRESLKTKNINIPDDELDELESGYLRQSDYDRNLNKLKKEHDDRMKIEDTFHSELKKSEKKLQLVQKLESQLGPIENWSEETLKAVAAAHPELGEEEGDRGDRNRNRNRNDDRRFVPVEQVQQLIQEAINPLKDELTTRIDGYGSGAAIMIDFMADAPDYWRETYGTKFPKKEFSEFFAKSGTTNPQIALQMFEKPYATKKADDDRKTGEEAAEKRGYQSAMSKFGNVETPISQKTGMFFNAGSTPEIDPATGKPKEDGGKSSEVSREESKQRVGSAFVKALDSAERNGVGAAAGGSTTQ